jgi:DNA modification methylase
MTLPAPDWQSDDGTVSLYCADCLTILPLLPAGSVDAIVTDPPYGTSNDASGSGGYGRRQNHGNGRDGFVIANDNNTDVRDAVLAAYSKSIPCCVFGSPRMPDPPMQIKDRLVWDKMRPGMNGGPWRYTHESIFVSSGFIRISDADCSIIRAYPDQSLHVHAKPIELMIKLVATAPDGTICDPFMGSCSTGVACVRTGRRFIGIEMDRGYFDISVKRIQDAFADQGIFRQDEAKHEQATMFDEKGDA